MEPAFVGYPIYINCRDRLTPLLALTSWLERVGQDRITLLDNDSTYPPLLEYYERTSHRVIRLGRNIGHHSLWDAGVADDELDAGPYVYTDPDIVPVEECPDDALDFFAYVLREHPELDKVGFGLKIDDLPEHYRFKQQVQAWESQFWERRIGSELYMAPIDTTFALYRPGTGHRLDRCVRSGPPYVARHTAWYIDSENPPEEERYYRDHARTDVNHWDGEALPDSLTKKIELLRAWQEEPPLTDQTAFTPWAEKGWHAWTDTSPELEFCELVAALVRLAKPRMVIETGVGQGFVTRRIVPELGPGQHLLCFEADHVLRQQLETLDFFTGDRVVLSERPSPSHRDLEQAGLTILGSSLPIRSEELRAWAASANGPGSLLVVHDCGNQDPPHRGDAAFLALIKDLGIPGVFLRNPRGAFLGVGPPRASVRSDRVDASSQLRLEEAVQAAAAAEDELRAIKATRSYRYTAPARRLREALRLRRPRHGSG